MAQHIHIVDDDDAVCDSLTLLLEAHGYSVSVFSGGEAFLQTDLNAVNGPVLLDVRMPGRDGLAVLSDALAVNPELFIIMMSGHADVAMAVRALKKGASNFIEKPFQVSEILAQFKQFESQRQAAEDQHCAKAEARKKLAKLTPREHEVMACLVEGKPNKIVANDLGLSVRTVETHRARLLSKLDVRSLSDLVRISMMES